MKTFEDLRNKRNKRTKLDRAAFEARHGAEAWKTVEALLMVFPGSVVREEE